MSQLDGIDIFVAVVQARSFSGAARNLGISKSSVSKRLRRLEDRLGARLLDRTTRTLTLTDAGRGFFERCARILEDLSEAELAISLLHEAPRGTLRLALPMSFGIRYAGDAVAEFLQLYPEVDIDMHLSDRKVDIVDEGFDLAVRIGDLADSSLIARKLAPTRLYIVASPAFFTERGHPTTPLDLDGCPGFLYAYSDPAGRWTLRRGDEEVSVRPQRRVRTNNGDALLDAARRGLGVAMLPDFLVADDLGSGRLVSVLDDWTDWKAAVWAVYPENRYLAPKVRLFVDFLVERWAPSPPWAAGGRL